MAFLGFLNLIFKCFDLLAWPLFALGYPLCASIRAIETNSNHHMRELVTYWILFSLISLFELAFVKLIEWVPLWQYIKLGTICWLVLPRFKGAHYCYKSFVHPCLSLNLKEVMNKLYKRQEASLGKDIFLSVAERYVSENGTEALEKLIANKGSRTDFGVEEIKAVADAEIFFLSPTVKSCCNEFNVNQKDINKVELPEKNAQVAANWSYCNEFDADQKDINEVELPGKNALVAANWVNPAETVHVQAEKKTIAAVEVKEVTVPPFPPAAAEKMPSEKVQKEWTSAACQVNPAETVHVQAEKKTIAAVEVKEVTVPPFPPAAAEKMPSEKVQKEWTSTACQVNPAETVHVQAEKKTIAAVEVKEVTPFPPAAAEKMPSEKVQKEWTSAACQVKPAETVHVQAEKKTIAAVEVKEVTVPPFPLAAAEKMPSEKVQKEWTCAACQVTTTCEKNLNSHLVGRKHIAKLKSMAIKQTAKNEASSSSPASKASEASQDSKKYVSGDRLNKGKIKIKEQKVTVKVNIEPGTQNRNNNTNSGSKHYKSWCPYCAITCSSEIEFLSHLNGTKHLAKVQKKVQEWAGHSAGVQGWDYSGLPTG